MQTTKVSSIRASITAILFCAFAGVGYGLLWAEHCQFSSLAMGLISFSNSALLLTLGNLMWAIAIKRDATKALTLFVASAIFGFLVLGIVAESILKPGCTLTIKEFNRSH